ncbi:MAG: ntrB [Cyanobacteria bacterium RYN_339]|nr:ntrB [Cyanobacteria bacterium RYN_339]
MTRILVVDDRADNRLLMAEALEALYDIEQADGGQAAIAAIERRRPQLVLLDLAMPEPDGFAVLRYLRDHPGGFLPVIVVSAVADRARRMAALELGANEVLARPFDLDELLVRVKNMVALSGARAAVEQRATDLEEVVAHRTAELRKALHDLQQSFRYKDQFLGVISHELRTPLNFIMGSASILEDGLAGKLTAEQGAQVARILKGGDRMMQLVSNLLDMSMLAAGKLDVQLKAASYEPIIAQALAEILPVASLQGVTVAADVQVPGPVMLDELRTSQVLAHLVGNAVKFTPAGGHVEIKAFLRDHDLVTEVMDNGVGIATSDQPRLFRRLEQLDMTSTRKFEGSGLGLSIAKGIVEAQGGRIGVRSRLGIGSTFWFSLPLQERHAVGSVK